MPLERTIEHLRKLQKIATDYRDAIVGASEEFKKELAVEAMAKIIALYERKDKDG